MYEGLARRLVRLAVKAGAIQQDEEELYMYAYQSLLASVLSWASLLLIAAVLQAFWGAVAFMLFFMPLRAYSGGYHAGSYLRCYLLSVASFLALVLACPFLARTLPVWALCAVAGASVIAIFLRAPVADPNKPLDDAERRQYGRRARVTVLVEVAALALMLALGAPRTLVLFALAGPALSAWLVVCPARAVPAEEPEEPAEEITNEPAEEAAAQQTEGKAGR